MEETFESLGFERATNAENKPQVGEKGQPLYMKGFGKAYDHNIRFYQIIGSRDPTTLDYELCIDPPEHLKKTDIPNLEGLLKEFRKQKGIPADVEFKIKVEVTYKFPEGPKVKGKNLNQVYDDFEKALIGLGYIERSIRDKKSVVIKGWQVGLV